jgi:hypothetical protein
MGLQQTKEKKRDEEIFEDKIPEQESPNREGWGGSVVECVSWGSIPSTVKTKQNRTTDGQCLRFAALLTEADTNLGLSCQTVEYGDRETIL